MSQPPPNGPYGPPFYGPPGAGPVPGAPVRRRKVNARIVVLVVVAAIAVASVPFALLWAFSRGAITKAAADLPEDICRTVHQAVGDDDDSLDIVENDLDDRSYAVCRVATAGDDAGDVRVVTVEISRMASTSFAYALSRADELADAFCAGADVGTSQSPTRSGLTALGGSSACVASVVNPGPGNVTVALGGTPPGHEDTFVGITSLMAGGEDDVDAAMSTAQDIVRRIMLRL